MVGERCSGDRGGVDNGLLHGQQIAVRWLVQGAQALIWYGAAFYLVGFLARKGVISSIFTPLITMPNLIVIHLITNQMVLFMGTATDTGTMITIVLRDIVILLIFDVMFSNYVARMHPAFSETPVDLAREQPLPAPVKPDTTPVPAVTQAQPASLLPAVPETAAPEPAQPALPAIRIGGRTFNPADIVALRAEAHIVNVYIGRQRHPVRARLSEAVAKLDTRLGVQINRSARVAYASISAFSDADGAMVLRDGTEERVAVLRRHAVRLAYENYQQAMRDSAPW